MKINPFEGEFEINASPKSLFQYLNSAAGLAQWFAEDVNVKSNQRLEMTIDGDVYMAKIVGEIPNKSVTLEFLQEGEERNPYLRIDVEMNELTQSVYLYITDASNMVDNEEDFFDVWEGLIENLKDKVGA
jgi:uncharacterized protein YndB with AHSA1/START domain